MTTFIIEFWDPAHSRYRAGWTGHNIDMALKMFNKPYNVRHTRRLREVRDVVSRRAKKGKRG